MAATEDIRTAAAYIRVSTDDQVELSPASQLTEIRKWAAAHGYIVPDEYVFADEGITGRKVVGRDSFKRMIGVAKLKPKPFDAILLWKFSRFARNRDDAVFYKSILRKQLAIEVISISEPVIEGKMGIITEALIEAMDEYYSINLAEEVKRGMEEKHRRGELQTTPSFGYTVVDNVLTPLEPEAAYVREIFRRFADGEGCYPISRWLNDMGIRTHRGNSFENRTVEYILRNPVYIGKLRWNPAGRTRRDYSAPGLILADGKHQPLIDEETWYTVQQRLDELKQVWKYHARPASCSKDWISGLVRCSECGSTLVFVKPHYWKCNSYAKGKCRVSQHVSSDLLKAALISRLQHDTAVSEKLSFDVVYAKAAEADELNLLQLRRESLTRTLSRLREAYLAGVDTIDEYKAAKDSTISSLREVNERIEEYERRCSKADAAKQLKHDIEQALKTITSEETTMEQKHEAAHSIISTATWNKADNLLKIHYRLIL